MLNVYSTVILIQSNCTLQWKCASRSSERCAPSLNTAVLSINSCVRATSRLSAGQCLVATRRTSFFSRTWRTKWCAHSACERKLGVRDVFRCPGGEYVESVAFSALTDTLCICTWRAEPQSTIVRLFVRTPTNSELAWTECPLLKRQMKVHWGALRALSDGRLILGSRYGSDGLQVLQVKREGISRAIEYLASIEQKFEHTGFDAQLAEDQVEMRLAMALEAKEIKPEGGVSLFRIETTIKRVRLVELSRCQLRAPWMPLFSATVCSYTRALRMSGDGRCTSWASDEKSQGRRYSNRSG